MSSKVSQVKFTGVNPRYSSWSCRGWFALKLLGVDFEEDTLNLIDPDFSSKAEKISPSKLFPCVTLTTTDESGKDTGKSHNIWDSFAIAEWAYEYATETGNTAAKNALYPSDWECRALARSAIAEMHSGFPAIRTHCSSNFVTKRPFTPEKWWDNTNVEKELTRIISLWKSCREKYVERKSDSSDAASEDQGFLFGTFGLVDAFFVPVVYRIKHYSLPVKDEFALEYMNKVMNHKYVLEWQDKANKDTIILPHYEYI
ncbi:hypothetical protein AX774_g7995 [Zancudomyces culisetae]|uniref:GST N-terminal domain-containing protein n=1 Tax=Zancudomyces culisetae TaxID=1213189 RepID=A0A1R1PCA7_ZANCU|nr:hypothetical protein AX774_g7995 [Zancudomyces culisetae]|eukprot:OMH78607.1 hypothetical protein AX774_g7995 [Zancudomyces culisetae]